MLPASLPAAAARRRPTSKATIPAKTEQPRPAARLVHSGKEACEIAHLSHATCWRLISRGVLRITRIGRRTLVQNSSLELLIEHGAPSEPRVPKGNRRRAAG